MPQRIVRDARIRRAWFQYHQKANIVLRGLHGLDRTLCALIMYKLFDVSPDDPWVPLEAIALLTGSYASVSTIRRYLRVMAQRDFVVREIRERKLFYRATAKLQELHIRHIQIMSEAAEAMALSDKL